MIGSGARTVLALVVACVCRVPVAEGQVQVGTELTRERATYHFENPSNFDTDFLVPHFFEQTYVLDNLWLTGTAVYRLGVDWETSAGVTTQREALATDYDTFFNPGGITWVAGTTGDAKVRSFRLGQQVRLGRLAGVGLVGGYRLRVDTADFLAGDRTEIRNGLLVSRTTVTTREYTGAQRHELYVGMRWDRDVRGPWSLAIAGDVAPAAVHRLAIELPDKYPGVTLVYQTTALTGGARVELRRVGGRWPIVLAVHGHGTLNYSRTQYVDRYDVGAAVRFGRTW